MSKEELPSIDVSRLRVGMYVHLDLGWRAHPFPFSNFKLKSDSQIETIRSLGLAQVRYSPQKSDALPEPESKPVTVDAREATAPTVSPEEVAARQRREQLATQQAHLARCENRFSEASRSLKQIQQNARSDPAAARSAAEALVGGMVGEFAGERESAIRLLSERAGEESSLHAINVTVLSVLLGKACGFDPAMLRDVAIGALLHDIGKLELPGRLRWSSGDQLTPAERKLAQEHVAYGVALAKKMALSPGVQTVIAEHHERADGSGYPEALKGAQISPSSRVVCLINHYDNLCNPANPLQAMTPHDALAMIFARQRALFDAPTLALFVRMMGVYPPGSVVQLSDGRHAMVVSVNSARPLKPRVVVHDSAVAVEQALVLDLETAPEIEVRACLRPNQLPRSAFEYLSPRKRMCYFFESQTAPDAGEASGGEK